MKEERFRKVQSNFQDVLLKKHQPLKCMAFLSKYGIITHPFNLLKI